MNKSAPHKRGAHTGQRYKKTYNCACGNPATLQHQGYWICERCHSIKPDDFHTGGRVEDGRDWRRRLRARACSHHMHMFGMLGNGGRQTPVRHVAA